MLNTAAIAERLVALRGSRTQAEVARAIGTSVSAVAMYESGSRTPRDEVKLAIARFYGTTVEAIFFAQ